MKHKILALALALLLCATALAEVYEISEENQMNFGRLLINLIRAYETPAPGDAEAVQSVVDAIGVMSERDGEVAQAIADHWMRVYADPGYHLYIHDGGERATALEGTSIPDSPQHAFVVLGFKLERGEMTDELKQRCDAAAAAARSFPQAILVCSGGATGSKNPKNHTEAGMMKAYLTKNCGIDASRIIIDESARSTVENAVNTFAMMREHGVTSYTIVTSAYHQRWGQVDYNCMAAFYRQAYGYEVELLENYCCDIHYNEQYKNDARWALYHLSVMLGLPDEVTEAISTAIYGAAQT